MRLKKTHTEMSTSVEVLEIRRRGPLGRLAVKLRCEGKDHWVEPGETLDVDLRFTFENTP